MWCELASSQSTFVLRAAWCAFVWIRDLEDAGIEHVHCHFAGPHSIAAWMLHRLTGATYSITAHAVGIYTNHKLKKRLTEAVMVVSVSDYTTQYLEKHFPGIPRIVKVVCGVDPARFARNTPYSWGGVTRILSVGRLVEKKGFTYLVDAVALLVERGMDVQCTIIGEGMLRRDLERQIAERGVRDRFHLLGAQPGDAVRQEMERASVFVLPCVVPANGNADAAPVVIREAMSMELPMVATSAVACPEMIDSRNGLLVPERDSAALADAVAELAGSDEDHLRQLGRSGRQRVIDEFSLEKQGTILAEEFRRLGVVEPLAGETEECITDQ